MTYEGDGGMDRERALGASSRAGMQWAKRTPAQRQATARYVRGIRPVIGVWYEVLRAITTEGMLDVDAHYSRMLLLRSGLEAVAVPPDATHAHAALVAAFEQTLRACSAILTREPRDVIDRARDEALISFNAFEIEV